MLQQQLTIAGPVIYPLLLCSVLVIWLVLERVVILLSYPSIQRDKSVKAFQHNQLPQTEHTKGLWPGLNLLRASKHNSKAIRDEAVSVYLQRQRHYLFARLRWLSLLAAIAPLLGLLGTVLGIITMFQDVAGQNGPVTPALIASGMWEAMGTTAAGLIVAIVALSCGQSFSIWSEYRLTLMEQVLNECSLWLEQQGMPQENLEAIQNRQSNDNVIKQAVLSTSADGH